MPIFLLIRHGENDYVKKGLMAGRLPGVHLNKKGQEQATGGGRKTGRSAGKGDLFQSSGKGARDG